jgi:tellurite resistance protein
MALTDDLGALASGLSVNDAIEAYLAKLAALNQSTPAEDAMRAQSEAIVELMFLVAAVDGDVGAVELEQLGRCVAELVAVGVLGHVDPERLVPALAARLAAEDWTSRMRAASLALGTDELRQLGYRLGAGVAFADDRFEPEEEAALESIADALGLGREEAQAIRLEVQRTLLR